MSERSGFDVSALQRRVIKRAWKDAEYRKDLLKNPNRVLSSEIAKSDPGASLPKGIEIKVVEETPSTFYLVLPNNPDSFEDERDDGPDESALGTTITPSSIDVRINLWPWHTRRCRCHATWATLY